MSDKEQLYSMLDNMMDDKDQQAEIDFHDYLQGKMTDALHGAVMEETEEEKGYSPEVKARRAKEKKARQAKRDANPAYAQMDANNKAAAVKARAAEKKRGKRDKTDDDSSSEYAMLHGTD